MMKKSLCICSFIAMILFSTISFTSDSNNISIEKISDRLYLVTYQHPFLTHSLVLEMESGLLLADTGFASTAEEFKKQLESKFNKKVLYIINSHYHADHIGGNSLFADAVIIAHENTSKRMSEYYHLPRLTGSGIPNLDFSDALNLYIGGIQAQIRYAPNATTDGDLVVYFPSENILYLADAIAPDNYNLCDTIANGDPLGMIKNLRRYMDDYPANTRYFFGHGRELNKKEINEYYIDFLKIYDLAVNEFKSGKTVKEASESEEIKRFDRYTKIFPTLKANWLRAVDYSLKKGEVLPSICEPMTKEIMTGGIAKAKELYTKLKAEFPDKYNFSEDQLNFLGYQLISRNMLREAFDVLNLNAEMFPDSSNAFDSLGEVHMLLGNDDEALRSYKKSLELNPENGNAADKIRELTEKTR